MNRIIGLTGALLAAGALFAACSNSTGISPAAPIGGGGGIPIATPTAVPATPVVSATPTVTPTTTPTPTPSPSPPPPVTVTPAALTFQQPGQSLTFTASEANYTGGFTAAACQPAGIATVTPVSGSTTTFTVTSTGGGVCTIAVGDTTHIGNGATVTVTANNNGIIIQGKKR